MGYAIVLFFGPPTCQRIEDLRNGISQAAGLPASGNGRSRPHITLAVFDLLEPFEPGIRILERFSRTVFPFDIKLESVGWFPTAEGVMFLSPVVTRHLLDVHESLHRLLDEEGLISQSYYRPGKWVPHCTIAAGLPPYAAMMALNEILRSKVFGWVALSEVGLVEFDPIKYLSTFPLVGNGTAFG
jgi:2'-5' RNA ligase